MHRCSHRASLYNLIRVVTFDAAVMASGSLAHIMGCRVTFNDQYQVSDFIIIQGDHTEQIRLCKLGSKCSEGFERAQTTDFLYRSECQVCWFDVASALTVSITSERANGCSPSVPMGNRGRMIS